MTAVRSSEGFEIGQQVRLQKQFSRVITLEQSVDFRELLRQR
jgi:hypothetical protein